MFFFLYCECLSNFAPDHSWTRPLPGESFPIHSVDVGLSSRSSQQHPLTPVPYRPSERGCSSLASVLVTFCTCPACRPLSSLPLFPESGFSRRVSAFHFFYRSLRPRRRPAISFTLRPFFLTHELAISLPAAIIHMPAADLSLLRSLPTHWHVRRLHLIRRHPHQPGFVDVGASGPLVGLVFAVVLRSSYGGPPCKLVPGSQPAERWLKLSMGTPLLLRLLERWLHSRISPTRFSAGLAALPGSVYL